MKTRFFKKNIMFVAYIDIIISGTILYGTQNEIVLTAHKNEYNHGNVVWWPDPRTLRVLPWCGDGKLTVGEVLCEPRWKKDDTPQLASPRTVVGTSVAGWMNWASS